MKKTLAIVSVIVVSMAVSVLFLINKEGGIDYYIQSDYAQAYDLFLNDSAQNSDDEFRLAMLYMEGKGTSINLAKAEEVLLSAANKKNPEALYNLGVYKFTGVFSSTEEEQRGLKYVKESADLGLGEAQVLYAKLLMDDKTKTLEPNETLSQEYAKKAKGNGFIDGQLIYGMALFMEDKIDEAIKELEPIYSSNYPFPALALREIYSDTPEKLEWYGIDEWEAFGLIFELALRLEPRPLSIYGSLNEQRTQELLKKLEAAAELNSKEAITFLAQLYSDGFIIDQDKHQALAYLQPLIDAKDPEVLYLAYLIDIDNSQYLIDSAEQNYLPAIYRLSQMHEIVGVGFGYNPQLGKKYKEKAASLGSKEAILDILKAINQFSQQGPYTFSSSDVYEHDQYAKYAQQLLSIEPNSAIGNYHLGYAYKDGLGVGEDSSEAFQYINRAYTLQPENQIFAFQLADMYLQAIGTEVNPEKAVEIYQTLVKDNSLSEYTRHYAQIELVKDYYAYDLQKYISQEQIKNYLVSFFDEGNSYGAEDIMYRLGDIYLAEGNYEKAIEIYKQYLDESDVVKLAYAKALLQHNEEEDRVEAIRILKTVMESDERIGLKSWDELNDLLFENALDDAEVQIYIANMAAILGTERFIQYVEASFETNLDVAYTYVRRKLETTREQEDERALKSLYEKLLKIADKEYVPAFDQIHHEVEYYNFREMMQLTDEAMVMLYQKGAEFGSDQMKYEIGKFYRSGKYLQRDWEKALEYFQSQEDQTIGLTSSHIKSLQAAIKELDDIQTRVNNNEADGFYDLSELYRRGQLGKYEDQELAEKYLQKARDLGSIKYKESVISELRYSRNSDRRLQNIDQYNQYMIDVATSGYVRWQEILGERYLYGENIQVDREKARYWLEKAYENDKNGFNRALNSMNVFEYNIELAQKNNDAEAMYEVGFSYVRGVGVKKDDLKAMEWFEKSYQAAKNENSAFQLGHIYYRGAFDEQSEMIMEPDWDKAVLYYSTVSAQFQDYAQRKIDFYHDSILPSREGDVGAILRVEQFYEVEQNRFRQYQKLREQLLLKAIELGSEEAKIRYTERGSE